MGIITKIEDKLGNIVEKPFRDKNSLDPVSIEISLKRAIETKKKNILGKIVIPNKFSLIIDEKAYEEYEPFFDDFKRTLLKSLHAWIKEKGYDAIHEFDVKFSKGAFDEKTFDIFVSYGERIERKTGRSNDMKTQGLIEKTDGTGATKTIIGELIDTGTGEVFDIYKDETIIGRGSNCTIRLEEPNCVKKTCLPVISVW